MLSSDDPVRVFQRFATLDAVSNGRAEVILGRGSFTESFPLFGYDLGDYDKLFEEKLDLFVQAAGASSRSPGRGRPAPALHEQRCSHLPSPDRCARGSVWAATSIRSCAPAHYGLPMMLAIIGGDPLAFAPLVDLYHRALEHAGTGTKPVGMHSPGLHRCHRRAGPRRDVASLRGDADPHRRASAGWAPMSRAAVRPGDRPVRCAVRRRAGDRRREDRQGRRPALGLSRFDLKYSIGTLPHELLMNSIAPLRHRGHSVGPRPTPDG